MPFLCASNCQHSAVRRKDTNRTSELALGVERKKGRRARKKRSHLAGMKGAKRLLLNCIVRFTVSVLSEQRANGSYESLKRVCTAFAFIAALMEAFQASRGAKSKKQEEAQKTPPRA